jgi:putative addiction module killer protein
LYPVGYDYGVLRVLQTEVFTKWLDRLRDHRAKARITSRLIALRLGHFGHVRGVGGRLSELRIDVGPGYRLYFVRRQADVVVLLCGGDKSTQQRDIARAQFLAAEMK